MRLLFSAAAAGAILSLATIWRTPAPLTPRFSPMLVAQDDGPNLSPDTAAEQAAPAGDDGPDLSPNVAAEHAPNVEDEIRSEQSPRYAAHTLKSVPAAPPPPLAAPPHVPHFYSSGDVLEHPASVQNPLPTGHDAAK